MTTKWIATGLAALMVLVMVPSSNADHQIEYYDCSDVPEGEICDAEDPSFTPTVCLLHLCQTIVTVTIGTGYARDFKGGVEVPLDAGASGKDTKVSTGFAEEVKIFTKFFTNFTFYGIYNDRTNLELGFDQAEFYTDFVGVTEEDQDPRALRTCDQCTGQPNTFINGAVIPMFETPWLATGFPGGNRYQSFVWIEATRYVDLNGDNKYTPGQDITKASDTGHGTAFITVGDFI